MAERVICYPVDSINGILMELDSNPNVGPRGLDQTVFFAKMITMLRSEGKVADVNFTEGVDSVEETPPSTGAETVYDAADEAGNCPQ